MLKFEPVPSLKEFTQSLEDEARYFRINPDAVARFQQHQRAEAMREHLRQYPQYLAEQEQARRMAKLREAGRFIQGIEELENRGRKRS